MISRKGLTGGEMIFPVTRRKRFYDKKTGKSISAGKAIKLLNDGKRKQEKQVITTTTWLISPMWAIIGIFSFLLWITSN